VLKLVKDVLKCLAPKHLLWSTIAVNKIAIQELLASSQGNGGDFGSGCLRHFLCSKTRDCVKGISADASGDRVVVHS
jgi:hypothetical protein